MVYKSIFARILATILFLTIPVLCESADQEDSFQRYSVVPILGYTEETEFQIGVMALLFLKPDEQSGNVPEIGLTAYG